MVSDVGYLVGAIGTFFAILDPFGNLPFFIAYTNTLSAPVRRKTALVLSAFIFVAMAVFSSPGQMVASFSTYPCRLFQIAGELFCLALLFP